MYDIYGGDVRPLCWNAAVCADIFFFQSSLNLKKCAVWMIKHILIYRADLGMKWQKRWIETIVSESHAMKQYNWSYGQWTVVLYWLNS